MSLLNDVHKTNSGPIEKALRDADIARIGQARGLVLEGPHPIPQPKMAVRISSRILYKYKRGPDEETVLTRRMNAVSHPRRRRLGRRGEK